MQAKDLQHRKVRIATLPLINRCFATLGVRHRLEEKDPEKLTPP